MQMLQPLHFSGKVFKYFMVESDDLLFIFQRQGYFNFLHGLGDLVQSLHGPQQHAADDFFYKRIQGDDLIVDFKDDFIFHGIPP